MKNIYIKFKLNKDFIKIINITGGQREMIPTLAKAAVAAGCNGVFMEVHDNPKNAKSDASTQWPIDKLENILQTLLKVYEAVN